MSMKKMFIKENFASRGKRYRKGTIDDVHRDKIERFKKEGLVEDVGTSLGIECDSSTGGMKSNYLKKVCFYYGFPIAINGVWNIDKAISIYQDYDIIVFGDNYNDPSHEAHKDTVTIINRLRTEHPKIEIFGYVPCSVNGGTKDLSTDEIKHLIDLWDNINVTGIFYDEFGFDYGNTRERQNELLSYGKSKELNAFVNSWEDKYLYTTEPITIDWMPNFNPNPNSQTILLDSNDYSLYENLFWSAHDGQKASKPWRIYNPYDYYNKVQSEYGMTWYNKFGVKTVSLDGIHSSASDDDKISMRTLSILGSKILNIDGVAFGDEKWGSAGNFDIWGLPELDLVESGKHLTTVLLSPFPKVYTSNINGREYVLTWDVSTSETTDINEGTRTVSVNGVTTKNAWISVFDINDKLQSLNLKNNNEIVSPNGTVFILGVTDEGTLTVELKNKPPERVNILPNFESSEWTVVDGATDVVRNGANVSLTTPKAWEGISRWGWKAFEQGKTVTFEVAKMSENTNIQLWVNGKDILAFPNGNNVSKTITIPPTASADLSIVSSTPESTISVEGLYCYEN